MTAARALRDVTCQNSKVLHMVYTHLETRVGLKVPESMLGPPFPSCPNRLASMGLVFTLR